MADYKGVEVKDSVRPMLAHMPMFDEYRESLQSLQAVWDNLSLLGQLSGTTADISQTRAAFSELTGNLLNNLAERTLAKREQEMTSKAQVVIDILTRNLFERTADIGFLTTDDLIRKFAEDPQDPSAIKQRFREYVRKYSVYEDVVLLDRGGRILARLVADEDTPSVEEDWVRLALSTPAPYVEAFVHSSLFRGRAQSLIYAYRVTSSSGTVLGVLALCFRFADEMARIFRELAGSDDSSVMALLDGAGEVIASSDRWEIPVGAALNLPLHELRRIRFAGRNYLGVACATHGYQGYMGPGWRGLVLTPIDSAFEHHEDKVASTIAPSLVASAMSGGRAFPLSLQEIPRKAEAIRRDLNRSVWNATIRQNAGSGSSNPGFSTILLGEISRVGMRMGEVFTRSIGNLQTTVLASLMADCQFLASLAINIMDRNLYERANDCRWWALVPPIRTLMAADPDSDRAQGLERALKYINGLYTVYDNLLVFDAAGVVVAVSNPQYLPWVGVPLNEPWVAETLGIRDSQQYTVSRFEPTELYARRATYIYAAALRSDDDSRALGGIGIVFDSEPQFAAMLHDSLPTETSGEPVEGCFALFVDASARIIASTHADFGIGQQLAISPELLAPPAEGLSRLIEFGGQVMAVGARRSAGYREYKGAEDTYRNEVAALVFIPLGPYDADAMLSGTGTGAEQSAQRRHNGLSAGPSIDIATFCLGGHWLGLPVTAIAEAVELKGFVRLANAPRQVFGAQIYRDDTLSIYNLHAALGLDEPAVSDADSDGKQQVVVIRGEGESHFGILVDALGEVLNVAVSDIGDLASTYIGVAPVLASVVKNPHHEDRPMVVLLSVENMIGQLRL